MALRVFRNFVTLNMKFSGTVSVFCERSSSQANVDTSVDLAKVESKNKLSTLYVSGKYGGDMYQIVKPVIDVQFITDNIKKIKQSCDLRGIEFDCEYVISMSKEWYNHGKIYHGMTEKDQEYINELSRLESSGLRSEFEALTQERENFMEDLKTFKQKFHDIEEVAMPIFESIPNFVDLSTPPLRNVVDFCKEPSSYETAVLSHTEIGQKMKLLQFSDISPTAYYLSGILAELDLAIQFYFSEKLLNEKFAQMSCMDFCKSFIIAAVGLDPYCSNDSIQIKTKSSRETGQKLHLVGGASLESFCAYLTNMNADKSTLPIKYFSLGRRYDAKEKSSKLQNLFSVVQSPNVHYLILCEQSSEDHEFNALSDLLFSWYSDMKIPFRIVNIAAGNLTSTESKRKQLELWSPSLKQYVTVAYVSQHNDFISKRLRITYGKETVVEGYCSIVEGVVVKAPVLIGCIMENFQLSTNEFHIPDIFKQYFGSSQYE